MKKRIKFGIIPENNFWEIQCFKQARHDRKRNAKRHYYKWMRDYYFLVTAFKKYCRH